jgi:hypothetical protein
MRIDLEVHLLTGVSIGLTHQSTDLGEQIITFDLIVLRFIVGLVPESAQAAKD